MTRNTALLRAMLIPALVAATLGGCSSSGSDAGPTSSPTASPTQLAAITSLPASVELAVGQSVEVTLESNPSTGYEWQTTGGEPTVSVSKPELTPGKSENGMVGVPGTATITVTAKQPGTATVEFRYARSWENESVEPQALDVTVK